MSSLQLHSTQEGRQPWPWLMAPSGQPGAAPLEAALCWSRDPRVQASPQSCGLWGKEGGPELSIENWEGTFQAGGPA